jgi:phosphoserine aminotransferase
MLNLRWLKAQGGVGALEERNSSKATRLYAEIDSNPLFQGNVQQQDRSWMNATFITKNPDHEKPFLEACKAAGIIGIKGHRLAGGFRASMYNALPIESVDVLVQVMKDFAQKNG